MPPPTSSSARGQGQELSNPSGSPTSTEPVPPGAARPASSRPELFSSQPADAERVTVVYTASVQGYVAPCGCTAEPLGGVARLAAAIDEAKQKHHGRVVFVDAGDLLFEKPDAPTPADACQDEAKHELLVSTYARNGLAATVLGPLDDVRGAKWRDALMAKHGVLTVGAPAPRALGSAAPSKPWTVVDAGGIQVGITGFTLLEADVGSPEQVAKVSQVLSSSIKAMVAAGARVTVVLAQTTRLGARAIALSPQLPVIDAMIIGHDPGEVPAAPEQAGSATLVASAMQAQQLGVLEFDLTARTSPQVPLLLDDRLAGAERRQRILEKRVAQYRSQVDELEPGPRRDFLAGKLSAAELELAGVVGNALAEPPPKGPHLTARAVALVRGSDEERAALAALNAYEARVPELSRTCEAKIACAEPEAGAARYVGVTACQTCHAPAVAFWQQQRVTTSFVKSDGTSGTREIGHAKAWKTLVDDKKDSDRSCVGCHAAGFMVPGGFCKSSDTRGLENVQCEACHGPGSIHVEKLGAKGVGIEREVPELRCRECHHVPHIPTTESFVYDEKLLLILGPGHGEIRRQALPKARP